jgi:hypothetical protein
MVHVRPKQRAVNPDLWRWTMAVPPKKIGGRWEFRKIVELLFVQERGQLVRELNLLPE